jgi:tripartite-type tricarboxylate transporter receptor subunit TctC
MRPRFADLFRVGVATLLLAASLAAAAQSYPAKPVRIIVPFAPGGGNDFIARFIAQRLSVALGQQFVVENRPGAGGMIGVEVGVKSPPDGYTLTLVSNSYTVNPSLYKLRFDPVADMTPVIQISRGPYLVVVHPSLPVTDLRELIAMAKSEPGRVFFASSGQGSVGHLATELFASMAGFKLNHVPYKGTGPALTDTIAGQTNALFGSTASTLPHVRNGRLRALAVTSATRLASEPGIATVAEAGVPSYETVLWHGLIGPKGMPRGVVERLNAEVTKLLQLKETGEQLQNDGVSPAGGTPEQFLATIVNEIAVWRRVVSEAGVKAE